MDGITIHVAADPVADDAIAQRQRLDRLAALADAIDQNVGSRPELATSQAGFAYGLIVNAIRSNPAAALEQLEAVGGLLGKAIVWVDQGIPPSDSELLAGLGA